MTSFGPQPSVPCGRRDGITQEKLQIAQTSETRADEKKISLHVMSSLSNRQAMTDPFKLYIHVVFLLPLLDLTFARPLPITKPNNSLSMPSPSL